MQKIKPFLLLYLLLGIINLADANTDRAIQQEAFIKNMQTQYGFDDAKLKALLDEAVVSQSILNAISKPAEKKLVWHQYRDLFIQEKRIKEGVDFWQQNSEKLRQAEKEFGVPAEIIIAIIGVETFYGRITGSYRVIDALHTLAFYYPKRASFFKKELAQFLLLAREQGFDPLSLKGSYAGAMGLPQFISSSYRHYAIDYDGDGVINIWNNNNDVIGSVANYLAEHGWQQDKPIIKRVAVQGKNYKQYINKDLKFDLSPTMLKQAGIMDSDSVFEQGESLKLFEYQFENDYQYWLAHKNFYVITRYNHSALYAMAVYQLATKIKNRMQ